MPQLRRPLSRVGTLLILWAGLFSSSCVEPNIHHPGVCREGSKGCDWDGDGFFDNCDWDGDGVKDDNPACTVDCDSSTPNDFVPTWFADADGDGWGDKVKHEEGCHQPTGYVDNHEDCNDTDAGIRPTAVEQCDGRDNNCDGLTDESTAIDATLWYLDEDQDDYGDASYPTSSCSAPSGMIEDGSDCDDTDADIHPNAVEECDQVDQDCDGERLDRDLDGDGASGCDVANPDCNDADSTIHPGALEVCGDSVDQDCSGEVNDLDEDSDNVSPISCGGGDCNDKEPTVYDGAPEKADNQDNNCDGRIDEGDTCETPLETEGLSYFRTNSDWFRGDISTFAGQGAPCEQVPAIGISGPDVFYRVLVAPGETLTAWLDSDRGEPSDVWDSVLWVLEDCAHPRCIAVADIRGADLGEKETLSIRAEQAHDWFLVVDGHDTGAAGAFELEVEITAE